MSILTKDTQIQSFFNDITAEEKTIQKDANLAAFNFGANEPIRPNEMTLEDINDEDFHSDIKQTAKPLVEVVADDIEDENSNVVKIAFTKDEQINSFITPNIEGLTFPNGLVGEVAKYIYLSSRMPIQSFSITAALMVVSHLSMNKYYVNGSRTGLNLYTTLIGDTTKGKDSPRTSIKNILSELDCTQSIDEAMSSGSALLKALSIRETHNTLLMSDEFGMVLQSATATNGASHHKEFFKDILMLYTASRTFWGGKPYANAKDTIPPIEHPFVNILGTTTPSEFIKGVTPATIVNGTLNRFLFIEANSNSKVNRNQKWEVPKTLVKVLSDILKNPDNNISMNYESGAGEYLANAADNLNPDTEYKELWGRFEENVIKVAAILSLPNKLISLENVKWAIAFITWSIESMIKRFKKELSNSKFEEDFKRIKAILENVKSYKDEKYSKYLKKGLMPKTKLQGLSRMKVKDLSDILEYLISSDEIELLEMDGYQVLRVLK